MFQQNQVHDFDPESTSLARLKKRRDALKTQGIGIAALNRLINKMERPLPAKGSAPAVMMQRWFCTEQQLKGWGFGKVRQPKTEDENKKRKGRNS